LDSPSPSTRPSRLSSTWPRESRHRGRSAPDHHPSTQVSPWVYIKGAPPDQPARSPASVTSIPSRDPPSRTRASTRSPDPRRTTCLMRSPTTAVSGDSAVGVPHRHGAAVPRRARREVCRGARPVGRSRPGLRERYPDDGRSGIGKLQPGGARRVLGPHCARTGCRASPIRSSRAAGRAFAWSGSTPTHLSSRTRCQPLSPNEGEGRQQEQDDRLREVLDYAACMREHAVPDFSDPEASGDGGMLSGELGPRVGIDPPQPSPARRSTKRARMLHRAQRRDSGTSCGSRTTPRNIRPRRTNRGRRSIPP
jgi:hypothetical protein